MLKLGRKSKCFDVKDMSKELAKQLNITPEYAREILETISVIATVKIYEYDSVVLAHNVVTLKRQANLSKPTGHEVPFAKIKLKPVLNTRLSKSFSQLAEKIQPNDYSFNKEELPPIWNVPPDKLIALRGMRFRMATREYMISSGMKLEDLPAEIREKDELEEKYGHFYNNTYKKKKAANSDPL